MKTKILVCCHKQDICASCEPYLPIQVGKAIASTDLGILGDNTGDNISVKNVSFCELTGLYWAWKNLKDVDVIGLCHYRRYFDFHNQSRRGFPINEMPSKSFGEVDLSIPMQLLQNLRPNEIIAPVPYVGIPLILDYCYNHISDDFKILSQVVNEKCNEESYGMYKKVMLQNKVRIANMFIMRWEDFDNYCKWLFDILFEVERRTNITNYSFYQKRIYGFMAERLLNSYIEINKMKVLDYPIINFTDQPLYDYNTVSYVRYKLRCMKFNMVTRLLKNWGEFNFSKLNV